MTTSIIVELPAQIYLLFWVFSCWKFYKTEILKKAFEGLVRTYVNLTGLSSWWRILIACQSLGPQEDSWEQKGFPSMENNFHLPSRASNGPLKCCSWGTKDSALEWYGGEGSSEHDRGTSKHCPFLFCLQKSSSIFSSSVLCFATACLYNIFAFLCIMM